MTKRVVTILLVLTLLLSFVSCGNSKEPQDSDALQQNGEVSEMQKDEGGSESYATYDSNALFKFGMLPAKSINDKWGFINIKGEWVIAPQYDYIVSDGFCENGYAIVKTSGQRKIIDLTGNIIEVVGLKEIESNDFSKDGILTVYIENQDEKVYLTMENGEAVIHENIKYNGDFGDDGLAVLSDAKGSSVINADFEYVLELQKNLYIGKYVNGFAVARMHDENNKVIKVGYLNTKGEWAIDLPVDYEPKNFNRIGIAAVRVEDPGYKDNRSLYYLIDKTGEKICEFKAVKVHYCENSDWIRYMSIGNEDTSSYSYHFINSKGETHNVSFCRRRTTDFLGSITNGRIVDEHKVYDESGNLIFEAEKYFFESDFHSDGYAVVKPWGSEFAIVDMEGNILLTEDEQNLIQEIEGYE